MPKAQKTEETTKAKVTKKTTVKKTESKELKPKNTEKKTKTVVEKPVTEKKIVTKKTSDTLPAGLKLDVFNTAGEKDGMITLPGEIFGAKINKQLIAQAVRIYLVNQRQGNASTKTRGEVDGSTRKIYRQKGTGRARHGGIRAPLFVKGGIAHGPKPKDYELSMPKKMKRAALFSALSSKVKDGEVKIVTGLELLESKTKVFAGVFEKCGVTIKRRNALLVLPNDIENVYRATRNMAGVSITTAQRLNTYEILQHKVVVFMKGAITSLEEKFRSEK